ncbi:hypothetical protein A9P82_08745 [Arachidicoccus ginsenosidimutans]|nr:hypothetical protein A9P82_08745 [Arachidicoccus sp. BS20]
MGFHGNGNRSLYGRAVIQRSENKGNTLLPFPFLELAAQSCLLRQNISFCLQRRRKQTRTGIT